MNQFVTHFFAYDAMYIILAFTVGVIVYWLYDLNRNPKNSINLIDLISVGGRLNERKLSRFGAWIVSTWGFIYLITKDGLTEWYFIGYMGAWVANALIGKAIKDPNGEESPTNKE